MNKNNRVLIVDDMHESILPLLKNDGYDPVYLPVITRKEILEIVDQFMGLIIRSKTNVDQELIDSASNLRFVARAGAGIDKLDEAYLDAKGIKIINAPEGNRDALAEHTLGILLSVLHRLIVSFDQVKEGIWDREGNRGIELKSKVVGIYGVGYMGKAFASKLSGMQCEVIGYDKYNDDFEDETIKSVSLSELMERTEILSIHIPLTGETNQLFDAAYLERFENLKILVNTSRGGVLKTEALVAMLEGGRLYGAALDVLENEKPTTYSDQERALNEKLVTHPNTIVTPHVGGWTYESYRRINEVIVGKLRSAFPN